MGLKICGFLDHVKENLPQKGGGGALSRLAIPAPSPCKKRGVARTYSWTSNFRHGSRVDISGGDDIVVLQILQLPSLKARQCLWLWNEYDPVAVTVFVPASI